jgi:sugar lactone lactonase YvrE
VTPEACGTFITIWGGFGSDPGRFNFPAGVALDGDRNVLVVDGGNNRVQKFTGSGTFLASFGSVGSGEVEFDGPNGIAVSAGGAIFVADSNNSRIQKLTAAGTFVTAWGKAGSDIGEFSARRLLAIDASGNVFGRRPLQQPHPEVHRYRDIPHQVGHRRHGRRAARKPDGRCRRRRRQRLRHRLLQRPRPEVHVGRSVRLQVGRDLARSRPLQRTDGIGVDRDGNVFVVDDGNDRIQKFTGDGVFLAAWGSLGNQNGPVQRARRRGDRRRRHRVRHRRGTPRAGSSRVLERACAAASTQRNTS